MMLRLSVPDADDPTATTGPQMADAASLTQVRHQDLMFLGSIVKKVSEHMSLTLTTRTW